MADRPMTYDRIKGRRYERIAAALAALGEVPAGTPGRTHTTGQCWRHHADCLANHLHYILTQEEHHAG